MQSAESFLQELDNRIARNRMLDHPLYQTWNSGKLSREALREYAKQYYRFVHVFPTLLSATHANTPHLPVRQELLENLLEEERGEGNHPALWMKFVESLGVTNEEARTASSLPETEEAIGELRSVTRDGSYLEGVSALYAYESQIPQAAKVKIEGLKKFYGITDAESLSFFTVHEEADVYHSGDERKILAEYAVTQKERKDVLNAADRSAKAMLRLLDGVYRAYVQPSMS
ncbi:MAG TPA: CADD family putative folate metabolism protein [Bacteroidota bacterium]|nr:CADD family putative folate metabolism protein [Bacteroidota bacterium]